MKTILIEVETDRVALDFHAIDALVYDPPTKTTTAILRSGESVLLRGMDLHDVLDVFEDHLPLGDRS